VDLGLATRMVADEALADEATVVATRIAAGPTGAFGGVKQLLARSYDATLHDHLDAEAAAIAIAMAGADAQEGVAAFLERRKPAFRGA